jgi:hypothetical protein
LLQVDDLFELKVKLRCQKVSGPFITHTYEVPCPCPWAGEYTVGRKIGLERVTFLFKNVT